MTFAIDLSKNALPLPARPRSLILGEIEFGFNDRTRRLELHHFRGGVDHARQRHAPFEYGIGEGSDFFRQGPIRMGVRHAQP